MIKFLFKISIENGFINSELFYYWAEEVLIPEIERRRKVTGYEGEAILHLLNCAFGRYPDGTSDQVLVLDLGIFGLQKHFKKNIKANENCEQHINVDIQQIVNSWIRSTTPDKVVSAFNQAGIYKVEVEDNVYEVRSDIKKARAIRGIDHVECRNEISGNKTVVIPEIQNYGD